MKEYPESRIGIFDWQVSCCKLVRAPEEIRFEKDISSGAGI